MDKKSKSEKNLRKNYNNYKLINKQDIKQDKRKSFEKTNKFLCKKEMEMIKKYKKDYTKLCRISKNENINEGDITLDEKYQDYANLIYNFRNQLIYCFLSNNKNSDSFND